MQPPKQTLSKISAKGEKGDYGCSVGDPGCKEESANFVIFVELVKSVRLY
jgi:hypothetical protein